MVPTCEVDPIQIQLNTVRQTRYTNIKDDSILKIVLNKKPLEFIK